MKMRPFIEVIDRLIYSGLTLEEVMDLLARFISEHKMFEENVEKEESKLS